MGKYGFTDRALRKEPMSQEEALSTIKATEDLALSALFSVLWIWGPRINEAVRLEKRDFEILTHTIKVRMPLSKKRAKDQYHFLRASLISPGIEPLLNYLSNAEDGKLFKQSIRTYRRKLHKINPQTSPHWFRHTRATRLAEKTDDVMALVDWFGWSDPRPAMSYVQMTGKLAARLADKID